MAKGKGLGRVNIPPDRRIKGMSDTAKPGEGFSSQFGSTSLAEIADRISQRVDKHAPALSFKNNYQDSGRAPRGDPQARPEWDYIRNDAPCFFVKVKDSLGGRVDIVVADDMQAAIDLEQRRLNLSNGQIEEVTLIPNKVVIQHGARFLQENC